MKKIFVLLAALTIAAACPLSAQNRLGGGADGYSDTRTFVYDIEDKYADEHPTAKTVKLTLEFTRSAGTSASTIPASRPATTRARR